MLIRSRKKHCLCTRNCRIIRLLQNICSNGKLDFAAINVLVVVQNNSFYPAAGGDADDLEYANGSFHRLSLLSALVLG